LTESVVLGLVAGLVGMLVAALGVEALALLRFDGQLGSAAPFISRLRLDSIHVQHPATLAFTLALGMVTGLLFGALPAARTTNLSLAHVMKSADAGWMPMARGIGRLNVRSALLVIQIALAIVLLVGAGLMLRSLSRVLTIELGFEPGHVLTLRIDPPRAHYDDDARRVLLDSITDRIRALPGVEAVAVAGTVPLGGQDQATSFRINGAREAGEIGVHTVAPAYFGALRIPLIKGRLLTDDDYASAARVAVINETFARRRWPAEDPIGQRLSFGLAGWDQPGQEATIVGIVGDVKYRSVDMPVGFDAYVSYRQQPPVAASLVIRTSTAPSTLVNAIRRELASVDPTLPAFDVTLMTDAVREATARWRFSGLLLTVFAGLAVLLTAAGIYGMLACSVAARTREIGIRMALGAERVGVVGTVFLDACTICALGLAIGLPSAAVLARFMRGLLYDVQPADPGTLASVAAGVLLTALLAATLPAWRAARIDPASALRYE